MQYNWFDNKVKGDGISSESYDSKGITASLETGYSLGLNDYLGLNNENYEWLVQPQVQVTWMGVKQDSHIESNGTHISNSSYNNIQTRIGGRTFIREQNEYRNQDGTDFEPYLEVNWINNSRLYGVSMNGVSVKQSGSRNIGEIKTGINGNLTPTTGIWGNVGFQIGDNGYNDASVMLGLIYKF
ncbi:autotransporter outer membrane beta-barrel domain-containing protein [Salmonella enterica]|nr:autotransporter outer membrane beta-barrel domain-containing protein [Salmonella enterica]